MKQELAFHDIYDYYYQPFTQTLFFKILLIAGLLLVGAIISYIILRRGKKQLPAWAWALQQINSINLASCKTKKDYKNFYFKLTEILKDYLTKRYNWKLQNKTDEELITYLEEQNFNQELLNALSKMLSGAVWIKFAGEDVIKTQAEKDFEIAKNIIHQTIPQDPQH